MESGNPIKSFRERSGLTQEQFARQIDVTRETVARWELGIRKIGAENLPKVAGFTGFSIRELRPDLFEVAQ